MGGREGKKLNQFLHCIWKTVDLICIYHSRAENCMRYPCRVFKLLQYWASKKSQCQTIDLTIVLSNRTEVMLVGKGDALE